MPKSGVIFTIKRHIRPDCPEEYRSEVEEPIEQALVFELRLVAQVIQRVDGGSEIQHVLKNVLTDKSDSELPKDSGDDESDDVPF